MKCIAISVVLLLLAMPAQAESEIVTFPVTEFSGETTVLRAKLNKPDGEGPFPAVVLLHGCGGTDLERTWPNYSLLSSWGYVTLRIDSFGPRGIAQVCDLENRYVGSPAVRALDAHAGKDFLASLPYVDGNRIGLVGWSHGGWTVLKAVSNDAMHEPLRSDPFKAAVAFYPYCGDLVLRRLDAPLLVLIGDADSWTRASHCQSLTLEGETTHDYELVVYPGATHTFDWDDIEPEYLGHKFTFDPEATQDAYRRMRELLDLHLGRP